MLVVNTKNYKFGRELLRVVQFVQKNNPGAIICVPSTDIRSIKKNTKLKVFSQHINDKPSETTTGFLTAEAVKAAGASGTLLNHSEHRLPITIIHNIMKRCRELNLKVIVCASTIREVKQILKLHDKPWAIAYEDPKLISSGKSITKHNPRAIKKFVKLISTHKKIIPLCGAGINSMRDYKESEKLGCKGVLVASAIAKKNPSRFF